MPRRSKEATSKHTLHLREGDYQKLQSWYPSTGAAPVIRKIVSQFVDNIERSTEEEPPEVVNVDF